MALLLTRFDFIFSVWASCYCFAYLLFIHILLYSYPRAPRRCFITTGAMFIYVYLFVINGIGGDNAAQVKYGLHVTLYANLNFPVMPQRGPCFVSLCVTFCCLCLEENVSVSGTDVQDKFPSGEMKVFFPLSLHLNYLDIFFNFLSETHQQPFYCVPEIRSNERNA